MSSSAITTQVAQLKIGNVQNQADSTSVYSNGVWSFKNSTALTSVTITDSGNVGIGTDSPAVLSFKTLNIAGGASGALFRLSSTAVQCSLVANQTLGSFNIATETSHPIQFYTNGSERMRLDASGNLLVGSTNNPWNAKLVALSTGAAANISTTSTTATGIEIDVASNNTTQQALLVYSVANNASNAIIYSNGTFGSRTGTYGGISDIKLKENVVDTTSKLEDLCKVRVVNYNLIGEQEKHLGVIAQELEQVFPGMVFESPDRDAEGEETGEVTKLVKYSVFIPMLVKAIQELSAKNEALEARLAASDARLAALEAK